MGKRNRKFTRQSKVALARLTDTPQPLEQLGVAEEVLFDLTILGFAQADLIGGKAHYCRTAKGRERQETLSATKGAN